MPETADDITNIEQPIPVAAQWIISDTIGQLRSSNDLASILQSALEALTTVCQAHRGLIWQVEGDQIAVTNEFATDGRTCFVGNMLGEQESTAIVLDFIRRFPDESGAGIISIPDTEQDTRTQQYQTLSSLLQAGNVHSRLMAHLRSRGIVVGFIELQDYEARVWTELDAITLKSVGDFLSVVVRQSFDQSKTEEDAKEMKLINEISCLFRENRGNRTGWSKGSISSNLTALAKSVMLVADHVGFTQSQIYFYSEAENALIAQIQDRGIQAVKLTEKDDPFVAVYESGRSKVVSADSSTTDPYFGNDMALILPLISKGESLGVIGLWQRMPSRRKFRPQDRELALTIAGHLANVIRAERDILRLLGDMPDRLK